MALMDIRPSRTLSYVTVKLIFVNRYFAPDISATSQLLTELAQHLAGTGREVHVVTSRQLYDDARAQLPHRETMDRVHVHRVWTTRFGRSGLAGRSIDYLTFYFSVGIALDRMADAGDVIVAETDPPLVSVVAAWVARRRNARLVNWLQDIFPEVAERLGVGILAGWLGSVFRKLRDYSLRAASANVVLGDLMAETLRRTQATDEARITVIHNWSDGRLIRPGSSDRNPLRREWGLSRKFVVGYSGNMGRAHEVETIVRAAERLRGVPDIAFLIIGGGKNQAWLEAEVERRGLGASFQFHGYQPRERLAESLGASDVHLVSLKPELEGLIVPSKFYGIAAAGRPTLFIGDRNGEIPRILDEADCGLSFSVGDDAGLSRAIEALRHDSGRVGLMGANARQAFERRFDKPRAMTQWDELLSRVAEAS